MKARESHVCGHYGPRPPALHMHLTIQMAGSSGSGHCLDQADGVCRALALLSAHHRRSRPIPRRRACWIRRHRAAMPKPCPSCRHGPVSANSALGVLDGTRPSHRVDLPAASDRHTVCKQRAICQSHSRFCVKLPASHKINCLDSSEKNTQTSFGRLRTSDRPFVLGPDRHSRPASIASSISSSSSHRLRQSRGTTQPARAMRQTQIHHAGRSPSLSTSRGFDIEFDRSPPCRSPIHDPESGSRRSRRGFARGSQDVALSGSRPHPPSGASARRVFRKKSRRASQQRAFAPRSRPARGLPPTAKSLPWRPRSVSMVQPRISGLHKKPSITASVQNQAMRADTWRDGVLRLLFIGSSKKQHHRPRIWTNVQNSIRHNQKPIIIVKTTAIHAQSNPRRDH